MSLDEQLSEILAQLGVVLEEHDEREKRETQATYEREGRFTYGASAREMGNESSGMRSSALSHDLNEDELVAEIEAIADISLFQTSREHYGVFYRLDLVCGVPQLRIFMPEDEGMLKMRCYLVRAAGGTPLHQWFLTSRAHQGSQAYEDARDAAHQHLLFAAGELMKRLFWTGEVEEMCFPQEISVVRLA